MRVDAASFLAVPCASFAEAVAANDMNALAVAFVQLI